MFVFGYGFDDADPNPARWARFAADRVQELAGAPPTFYWTLKTSVFAEPLFLHHRERFVRFHFVLDAPQSQFGHDWVTWNFGFDNLGVFRRDGLLRVVRLDRRYLEEMGWLAGATEPALVFIYSWNEPFEGSFLVPSMKWDDTKARLAKHYIQRLKQGAHPLPPKTLLIVDDLDEQWGARKDDWHLVMLRALLLYPMRRSAPQSDVRTVAEVSPALLDRYDAVIDLTSRKVEQVSDWLLERLDTHQLMIFDPLAGLNGGKLSRPFVSSLRYAPLNREVELIGASRRLFARDDVQDAVACRTCGVKLAARVRHGWWRGARTVPLVVARRDDVWVNAYSDNEDVLKAAFEALYRRPLGKSILYGEGLASQRLEVDPKTGKVTYNRLSRYAANQRWALPEDIDWYRLPDEVDERLFRFVFGLDE